MKPDGEFRLLQVSDCHLLPGADGRYRGLPALASLERVLEAGQRWRPDAWLFSGDLSEDASPASYDLLSESLRDIGADVLVLPGNHDDPEQLAGRFPRGPWQGPCAVEAGGWRIVMMDSTVPGDPAGAFDTSQLDALDAELAGTRAPVLVALHHQPLPVGSPGVGKDPVREAGAVTARRSRDPAVRVVTWGHVHHGWRKQQEGITWVAAPSSVANALPWRERFEADPGGPACRWFRLWKSGDFATGLLRPAPGRTGGA
ncbi:MAG: metallophosphoesterase [Xanthomonadales bacterium]|nr:metallophosphoesterase [Xanthomonadales bacterium]